MTKDSTGSDVLSASTDDTSETAAQVNRRSTTPPKTLPVWIYLLATAVAALAAIGVILGLRQLTGDDRGGEAASVTEGSDSGEDDAAEDDGFSFLPENNATVGDLVPSTPYLNAASESETLEVYRGQHLVVNFWASTCAPCITEMPEFEEVFQQYSASDDVAFIGINFGDTGDAVDEMVELTGVTYDIGRDTDRRVMTDFGSTTLPTTALVDPNGRIVEVRTGPVSKAALGSFVEAMLAE